jgi:hypothetical protein
LAFQHLAINIYALDFVLLLSELGLVVLNRYFPQTRLAGSKDFSTSGPFPQGVKHVKSLVIIGISVKIGIERMMRVICFANNVLCTKHFGRGELFFFPLASFGSLRGMAYFLALVD